MEDLNFKIKKINSISFKNKENNEIYFEIKVANEPYCRFCKAFHECELKKIVSSCGKYPEGPPVKKKMNITKILVNKFLNILLLQRVKNF